MSDSDRLLEQSNTGGTLFAHAFTASQNSQTIQLSTISPNNYVSSFQFCVNRPPKLFKY